jgi:hypothetical protein
MISSRIVGNIGPFALYAIGAIALFPLYQHMINPDTISYLSIAQHYLAGDWSEAVNTNWSPMFSWFLAPLLALHTPGLLASRVVCFVSGLLALLGVQLLGRSFGLRSGYQSLVLYTSAAMIVAFALLRAEPDLLEAAILLFYFRLVFDRTYFSSRWMGVVCGLLGAAAFLAKGYAFYFFLLHFTTMNLLHGVLAPKERRSAVAVNFGLGMLVFVLCSGPWIALMSAKAGHFTVGTTGDFNYRLVGPDSQGYPQYHQLIPPPSEHALSMWEEPAASLLPRWSALRSMRELRHQLKLVAINLRGVVRLFVYTSLLSIPILALYAIAGLRSEAGARYYWLLPMVTIFLMPAGYLLVIVLDRYLWSILLLLPLMGAVVLQKYLVIVPGRLLRAAVVSCFAGSFLLLPARMLQVQRHSDDRIFELSEQTHQHGTLHGRLAACGNWNDSLYLAYYMGAPFYGSTGATAAEDLVTRQLNPSASSGPSEPDPGRIRKDLEADKIRYYLMWPNCRYVPPEVLQHAEITGDSIHTLKIYDLSK